MSLSKRSFLAAAAATIVSAAIPAVVMAKSARVPSKPSKAMVRARLARRQFVSTVQAYSQLPRDMQVHPLLEESIKETGDTLIQNGVIVDYTCVASSRPGTMCSLDFCVKPFNDSDFIYFTV